MKTNYLKKCISVLLSISMLASLFAVSFTASAEEVLVVDGKSYQKGDIVELKGDLQINNWLMNGQVEIPYDSTKLQLVDGQTEETIFPALSEQNIKVFYNDIAAENVFLFNFSNPTVGIDFTESKTLYSLKFEVIGTGDIKLADNVKIVDMKSYAFEGSPEGQDNFEMVSVIDENGAILEGKGTVTNVSQPMGPVEETLTVDGKTYNIDDTFTFAGDLQVNRWVMNTQIELNYDNTKLEIVDTVYPVLEKAGIKVYENYINDEGWYSFNFSDVSNGVDFTEKGELYVVTFKVVGNGTTTLNDKINIIEMSEFPFDGSPAENPGAELIPVDITDGNGVFNGDKGSFENSIKEEVAEKTLTVDGKTYNVGEKFTLVGQLQANRWLINAQFNLDFDNTKIKIVDTAYPVLEEAGISAVENYNNDEGWYTFNFTDVENGADFTSVANLYEVTFEVIDGGTTTLADKAAFDVICTFPFAGSPAVNPGAEIEMVDISDGNGGIKEGEGKVEHIIDPEPPVVDTLVVDGHLYKLGDTVRFNIDLQAYNWIMNGQYTLNFDNTKLQLKSAYYPVLEEAGINVVENINNEDGFYTFNFLDIEKGVDFTTKNVLVAMEFKVIGTGEAMLDKNSVIDALSTFDFEGSPADPENEGKPINMVDITEGLNGVNPEYGELEYYQGKPNIIEKFTVNGQEVKAGDIVEYRVWVKNDKYWLVNSEFDILYTNHYLDLIEVTYPGLESIAGYVVDNNIVDSGLLESQGKTAGEFLFNFTNIHSGVDFTQGAYMAVLKFKVHESTNPEIPATGASVIELNNNVVNDMNVFPFEGSGASHDIEDKRDLVNVIGEDGLPTTDEFRLETEVISEVTLDWEALQEAYDKWAAFDTDGYTAESVAALQEALAETKKMLDDFNAGNFDGYTQDMIDQQLEKLNAAGEALVVDKSQLEALIDDAKAILEDKDTLYVPETIEALKEAVDKAQAVVNNENATVQEVKDEIEALQKAIDGVKKGAYLGDVNYDGRITIVDATYIQLFAAEIETPEKFYEELADVDKDGKINILDATEIQKILALYMPWEIVEIPAGV